MKSRSILYALIALIVLIVLVLVIRPKSPPSTQSSSTQIKEYSFALTDKTLSSGPSQMSVTEGEHVRIALTSNADWPELHLHGYELKAAIKKDQPAMIDFTANKTGSFALEVHFVDEPDNGKSDDSSSPNPESADELQISHLEVQPK